MPSINGVRPWTNSAHVGQPTALEQLLSANPQLRTNQDLLNHLYERGGGTWAGAEQAGRQLGVNLNALVNNRSAELPRAAPQPAAPQLGGTSSTVDTADAVADDGFDALGTDQASTVTGGATSSTPDHLSSSTASPPAQNPRLRLLAQNPDIETNQDLINHFFDDGASWSEAASEAAEHGYDLSALTNDRDSPADGATGLGDPGSVDAGQAVPAVHHGPVSLGSGSRAIGRRWSGAGEVRTLKRGGATRAFQFTGKMAICADGAPNVTRSRSEARRTGKRYDPWWQRQTAMSFRGKPVNADKVPYVVLPPSLARLTGAKKGDLVKVEANGKSHYAIYAEVGPNAKLGEGSMFLARKLGINDDPFAGGKSNGVKYTFLPATGRDHGIRNGGPAQTDAQIQAAGAAAFAEALSKGYVR